MRECLRLCVYDDAGKDRQAWMPEWLLVKEDGERSNTEHVFTLHWKRTQSGQHVCKTSLVLFVWQKLRNNKCTNESNNAPITPVAIVTADDAEQGIKGASKFSVDLNPAGVLRSVFWGGQSPPLGPISRVLRYCSRTLAHTDSYCC